MGVHLGPAQAVKRSTEPTAVNARFATSWTILSFSPGKWSGTATVDFHLLLPCVSVRWDWRTDLHIDPLQLRPRWHCGTFLSLMREPIRCVGRRITGWHRAYPHCTVLLP